MAWTTPELPQTPASQALRARSGRNSRSLAQRLFDEFFEKINRGEWVEGDKFPTESELVQHYDVSRTVVREAISKLQAANLVETRHGIGTFVLAIPLKSTGLNPVELDTAVDVLAVLELRISIETETAGLAAQRRQKNHLATMRAALDAFKNSRSHQQDSVEHDLAFHLAIATATGNPYFVDVLKHFGSLLIPRARLSTIAPVVHDPDYLLRVDREHEEIFNAIDRQDAESARAAMRLHLINSRERLRMRLAEQSQTSPVS